MKENYDTMKPIAEALTMNIASIKIYQRINLCYQ